MFVARDTGRTSSIRYDFVLYGTKSHMQAAECKYIEKGENSKKYFTLMRPNKTQVFEQVMKTSDVYAIAMFFSNNFLHIDDEFTRFFGFGK